MSTKLLLEIGNVSQAEYFIEKGYGDLLLNIVDLSTAKEFSCYTNELALIAEKIEGTDIEIYINLDVIYHEDDLSGLKAILKRLPKYNIKNIIISDLGIIMLAKELGLDFNFINGVGMLNTNYASMNYLKNVFKGFVVSNELSIQEISEMAYKTQSNLLLQVFGKRKIFSSRRHLLQAYFNYLDRPLTDFSLRNYHMISDENEKDNYSYIFEDSYGTYIYTQENLVVLEYLQELKDTNISHFYLNNIFLDKEDYAKIVETYYLYLNDKLSFENANNIVKQTIKDVETSFFEDKTVYSLDKIKELDL